MAVVLDPVVRVGGAVVAALAELTMCAVLPNVGPFVGSKRPVMLLIRQDGTTAAFDADGARIPLDSLDRLFPGQREAFEEIADRTL